MIISKVIVGVFQANCYLIADEKTKETIIIDPGGEPGKIFNAIKENNLKPKFILLTHNHPDHIGAVEKLRTDLCVNTKVGPLLQLGELRIKTMATPGHTPEGKCFIIEDPAHSGISNIFTGDTLFKGSIGRTDFEGGDKEKMAKSIKLLSKFPDNFRVFPGHGEETTIGEEKRSNPFILSFI